jgi:hypothetical protein
MGDWVPVLEMPELRALIDQANQAPAAAAPPAAGMFPPAAAVAPAAAVTTTARRAGGRSQGTTDLFGGVATAGSENDVATSATALPGSTPYEAKPTGARNENSVLFSLDSLKIGLTAPAPGAAPVGNKPQAPERRAARPYSQPDDPFGMSAGNSGVAKLGGGGTNPLFGSDNQALLFAPPPPPDPPPRPVIRADPLAGQFADVLAPPARKLPSKRTLMIGGGVGLLVLIGVIALATSGGGEKTADATEGIKSETSEVEKPKPRPEPEAKKEEPPKPAETEKTAATSEKKEPSEAEKKAAASAPKKKTDSKPDEEKKSEPTPAVASGDGPPFNKGAAVSALTSASSAASGCKRPGGPTGTGKVTVTFAPNGRVTQASVAGGSYGGTSVGGCVASVFRRAKIPAFSGNAVTVSKSFNISP